MPARLRDALKYSLLPLLLSLYPAFFHYGNNPGSALPLELLNLVLILGGAAVAFYAIALLILRGRALQASLAASIFLIFFHTFGLIFLLLLKWDVFRVEQYSLLPPVIGVGLYAAWAAGRWEGTASAKVWQGALLIIALLVGFNVFKILGEQARTVLARNAEQRAPSPANAGEKRPDIYFFIYDEMAGFQAMRDYWHYDGVDQLADFLREQGFYVAEQSHGSSIDTQVEVATRLNYQPYSLKTSTSRSLQEAMADNRAMKYLKSLGYTTIAFDEMRQPIAYPSALPLQADILYENPDGPFKGSQQPFFSDFILLALDNTMLAPFLSSIKTESPITSAEMHRNMLFFTMDKVTRLEDVPGPKFVYVHVMIPHLPFMFKANGSLNSRERYFNWNSYLGNYQFTEKLIKKTVTELLSSADPQNPPVIVISSDHGARNLQHGDQKIMPNYPEEFKTLIVNALYLPGCDQSVLTQDMDPINTLPIVFNCYFDANIPLK